MENLTPLVPLSEALSYSPRDASRVTGLGLTTIYQLIKDGKLQRVKVGTRTLIPANSLRTLVEAEAA